MSLSTVLAKTALAKLVKTASLTVAFVMAGQAAALSPAEERDRPLLSADDSSVKIVRGKRPDIVNNNTVRFVLDAGHLGFFDRLSYATGTWSKFAVFFNGSMKDGDRLCPYFNLTGRDYRIEQIDAGKMEFLVTVKGTPEEAADAIGTISRFGCVITDTPDTDEIIFKNQHRDDAPALVVSTIQTKNNCAFIPLRARLCQ